MDGFLTFLVISSIVIESFQFWIAKIGSYLSSQEFRLRLVASDAVHIHVQSSQPVKKETKQYQSVVSEKIKGCHFTSLPKCSYLLGDFAMREFLK